MGLCSICFTETKLTCAICKIYLCCEEHSNAIWKSHKLIHSSFLESEESYLSPGLNESEAKLISKYLWNEFGLPQPDPATLNPKTPLSTFINLHLNSTPSTRSQLLAQYRNRISSICPPSFNSSTTHHPSYYPFYQIASLEIKSKPISNSIKNPFLKLLVIFYALQYIQGLFSIDETILDSQLYNLETYVVNLGKDKVQGGALLRCYFDHVKRREMILRDKMSDKIDEDVFDKRNEEEIMRFEMIMKTFGNVMSS